MFNNEKWQFIAASLLIKTVAVQEERIKGRAVWVAVSPLSKKKSRNNGIVAKGKMIKRLQVESTFLFIVLTALAISFYGGARRQHKHNYRSCN
jgi:hypothetical protein